MTVDELIENAMAQEGGIDTTHIRNGKMSEQDFGRLAHASQVLGNFELHIDAQAQITLSEIRAKARRLKNKLESRGKKLRLIAVDYLQLMGGTADSREERVANNTKGLKALAKELNVPVMALSQLNRDATKRPNKRPLMSDLRESGAAEHDSDLILLLYRGEYYGDPEMQKGEADIVIAKQRRGPVGDVRVEFVARWTSFRNASSQPEQQSTIHYDGPPPHSDEDGPDGR
jgi:replicative DNA helicase